MDEIKLLLHDLEKKIDHEIEDLFQKKIKILKKEIENLNSIILQKDTILEDSMKNILLVMKKINELLNNID